MEKEKINENYEVLDESKCDSSDDELDYYIEDCSFVEGVAQYFVNLWEDFNLAQWESSEELFYGDRFIEYVLTILYTMCTIGLAFIFVLAYCIINSIITSIYIDEVIAYFINNRMAFNIIKAFAFSPMIRIGADIALTVCRFLGYRLHRLSEWVDYFTKNNSDIKSVVDLVKNKSKEEEVKQERKKEEIQDKNEVLKQDVNLYEKRVQDVLFELDSDIEFENNSDHVHTYVNDRFNEFYNRICSLSDSDHKIFCLVSLKNAILSYKEEEKKGTSNINDLNATLNYILSCSNDYSENSDQRKLIK